MQNPATGVWAEDEQWTVVEELRIGSIDDVGPAMLGRVTDFELDALNRIWLFEGQAQELRVFDSTGSAREDDRPDRAKDRASSTR